MADNSEDSSKGVQQDWVQYPDQFSRLVFMVNDINRAEISGFTNPNLNKLFLAGYLPRPEFRSDLIQSIYELPHEFSYLEEALLAEPSEGKKDDVSSEEKGAVSSEGKKDTASSKGKKDAASSEERKGAVSSEGKKGAVSSEEKKGAVSSEEKKDSTIAPIQLPSFLLLLEELRNGLNSGRIHGSARWDILNLFLNIAGPRRDTMNRVLFYLYPPPGPFEPKEKPDGPSAPDGARTLYPLENLAFSLVYRPLARLKKREYSRYFSIWEKIRQRIENGSYGEVESKESVTKMSKALSGSKTLMRMLPRIPWPHLSEGSAAAAGAPTTPTRKSSTDEKGSGRST